MLDCTRLGADRAETIAVLTLLRIASRKGSWGDISGDVRLAGSAVAVLDEIKAERDGLLPDPEISDAETIAAANLADWEAQGLNLVTVLSSDYPAQLAGVFDCPPFLFYKGTLIANDQGMSVVGSRRSSARGEDIARTAARLLAERGLSVIAGLAEGIDAAAHREALRVQARTVAVIGTGINKYYPAANRKLQVEIENKGLVISQFYPDQPPNQTSFPMRNGTMSGYGLATIVVEAGEHSGTRIQARKAADHGRPVIIFEDVAKGTTWGKELSNRPWVSVFGTASELTAAIDQVLNYQYAESLATSDLVSA